MIVRCPNSNCANLSYPAALFQDERYGKGMRVHNEIKSQSPGTRRAACTICGQYFTSGDDKKK